MGQNGPDYAKNTIPNVNLKKLMEEIEANGGIFKGPPMKVVFDVPKTAPRTASLILLPEPGDLFDALGVVIDPRQHAERQRRDKHLVEFFAYETLMHCPPIKWPPVENVSWGPSQMAYGYDAVMQPAPKAPTQMSFFSTPNSQENQFEQMWLNEWGPPDNKVFDPPIKTDPPHKEDPHPQVGFYSYDKTGEAQNMKPLNDKLLAKDDIEKYEGAQGEHYENPSNSTGYTSIDVLEDLWGMPYNNLILAYVHALRPSKVRVSYGEQTLDSCCWRVSIVLEDKEGETFVHSIRQEVAIAYSSGADVGTVKNCVYNDEPPPDTKVAGGCIGHTAGLAKADFS